MKFNIGKFEIGGDKTFIIAELSANHNGSIEVAKKTIHAVKEAGADCIKLQTYTADTITLNCDKEDFQIKGTIWDGKRLHDLYQGYGLHPKYYSDIIGKISKRNYDYGDRVDENILE